MTKHGRAARFLDPRRYIIQIWTSGIDLTIAELYQQGYRLIISNFDAWYLDHGYGAWLSYVPNKLTNPYVSWQRVYENSPRKMIGNFNLQYNQRQILGGEAALRSEQV